MEQNYFRPFYGVSLFLLKKEDVLKFKQMFSSPLRSISISTTLMKRQLEQRRSFRPLFGVSLFLLSNFAFPKFRTKLFVPSSGYLYFYLHETELWYLLGAFSSPLRGISISTGKDLINERFNSMFSSPLRGISISTQIRNVRRKGENMFSSPLRSISISTVTMHLLVVV